MTPTRGGAIQLAYLPRSWHGFISEPMKFMSSSLGSHWPLASLPLVLRQNLARRADPMASELADPAVEPLVRLNELERDAGFLDHLVPAVDAALAIDDVVVKQPAVDRAERWNLFDDSLPSTTRVTP